MRRSKQGVAAVALALGMAACGDDDNGGGGGGGSAPEEAAKPKVVVR